MKQYHSTRITKAQHRAVAELYSLVELEKLAEPIKAKGYPGPMPCGAEIHDPDKYGYYDEEDDEPVDDYDYDEDKVGFVFIIDKEKRHE